MLAEHLQAAPPALWQQLQSTAHVLRGTLGGQSLTAQLQGVPAPLRAGVQALSFQVLRQLGRAQALRHVLAPRRPAPAVDALLCTALALSCDPAQAPYPEHTLVSQAVEAARGQRSTQAQAGFINACLRRFMRERAALMAQTDADPQAQWNHPLWWIERLQQDHPLHWQALLHQAQQHPPMTLRVNRQRHSVAQYQARLQAAGWPAGVPVGECGLQLAQPLPVQTLPGFAQGDVSVQDAAAQLAAPLLLAGLPNRPGLRLLDACAAPGGKTGHLLELRPDAQVLALDVDAARAQRIAQNLQRLNLNTPLPPQVRVGDARQVNDWWDGQAFDGILLDAPCTASGIVRRHPDVRWLRRPQDSAQLARTQLELLECLWPLLAPGGRLLYCTCSVFRAEGQEVLQAFVQRNTQARSRPCVGHLLAGTDPSTQALGHNGLGEHDNFYYALLEKSELA